MYGLEIRWSRTNEARQRPLIAGVSAVLRRNVRMTQFTLGKKTLSDAAWIAAKLLNSDEIPRSIMI